MNTTAIKQTVNHIKKGSIVAYPTEAVYGLGCDPFNAEAVARLRDIKKRTMNKGFILIAADWMQIKKLVKTIAPEKLNVALDSWPGPITWIFPASNQVPIWIRGEKNDIAVRVTSHPIAKQLCQTLGSPIISTSANISGQPPLRNHDAVRKQFKNDVDYILEGDVGDLPNPTEIRDVETGKIIRGVI